MKKLWIAITCMIISALLINVISADTGTYIVLTPNTEYQITTTNSGYKRCIVIKNNTSEVRARLYYKANREFNGFITSLNSFTIEMRVYTSATTYTTSNISVYSMTHDNDTYYTNRYSFGLSNYNPQYINTEITFGVIDSPDTTWTNEYTSYTYMFGSNAVEPDEEINYGTIPIEYSQNLITEHPENNLDIIRWYGTQDNNGNDLSNVNLEIQAVAGYFEGSSYADLKTNTFTDWQQSTHPAVEVYNGSYTLIHETSKRWGEIATDFRSINTLGTWFWNIFTSEDTWYQYGWRYRYRLTDSEGEPLTDWEFIYTGNSYSPSATEILTDPEPMTPDTIETINDINDENGTVNNWYINNTVINNNEYNQTYQQNLIQNIYNILQGDPDPVKHELANDTQTIVNNAINTENDYNELLGDQLQDLQLNDITQNTGLMKALRWIREVHHETIEQTQLGGVILTVMLIGLITYLIGRRNG